MLIMVLLMPSLPIVKEKIDIFFLELVAILLAVHHVSLFQHPPKKLFLWTDSLDLVAAYNSLHASESCGLLIVLINLLTCCTKSRGKW